MAEMLGSECLCLFCGCVRLKMDKMKFTEEPTRAFSRGRRCRLALDLWLKYSVDLNGKRRTGKIVSVIEVCVFIGIYTDRESVIDA